MARHLMTELDSGERVISERLPGVRSVAIGFWIGAGSRDEPDARAGVSHFIEHLLFKGSSRYSAQEIAEIFDEMGGELNAATSRESTVVYARIPGRHLERAIDVMADMVFSPTFADVDAEREVEAREPEPPVAVLTEAAATGFPALLIDTWDKARGGLFDHWSTQAVAQFCQRT
jgi:predicted Zn-dependent peptidase